MKPVDTEHTFVVHCEGKECPREDSASGDVTSTLTGGTRMTECTTFHRSASDSTLEKRTNQMLHISTLLLLVPDIIPFDDDEGEE